MLVLHRRYQLGSKCSLSRIKMPSGLGSDSSVKANVENPFKLLGVLVLHELPCRLGGPLNGVSGLAVHLLDSLLNQDFLARTDELQALLLQTRQSLVELCFGFDATAKVARCRDTNYPVTVNHSMHFLDRP